MDAVEIDEDEAEQKFLVTPKEDRILAETKEDLAASLEARIREKGFDEASSFSAPAPAPAREKENGSLKKTDSKMQM